MFRPRSTLTAVVLCAAGLTACSGLSETEKTAAENISASLEGEYGDISVKDADCTAEKWVESIGLPALKKAKLIGDNLTVLGNVRDATLTAADAKRAAAGFEECGNIEKVVTGMIVDLFKPTDDQADCIADKVTTKAVAAWITSDLQGKVTDNVYVVGGRDCMSTPEDDAQAVKTLSGNLARGKGLNEEQATCVASGLVDQIGTYELIAAGVLNQDLTIPPTVPGTPMNRTDADIAATVTAGCLPFAELLSQPLPEGPDAAQLEVLKSCLADVFDDEAYHQYLVGSYMGTEGLTTEETKQLADCLRPTLEQIAEQQKKDQQKS